MTNMGHATRTLPPHTLWPTIVSPGAHVSAMTGSLSPLFTYVTLAHSQRVLRTRLRGNTRVGQPIHRAQSQGVRRGSHPLIDPGEIGLLAMGETCCTMVLLRPPYAG